jgi:cytochrome c
VGLVVLADASAGVAQTAPPGDAVAGAAIFDDRCAICHAGPAGGQGPNLDNVLGRRAASVAGFSYTPALKASGLTWTAAALNNFLTDPGKAVPGTAMIIRVPDAKERADLIAYFASRR